MVKIDGNGAGDSLIQVRNLDKGVLMEAQEKGGAS